MTQSEFLEKCHAVHGYVYDYSKVVYKNGESKIIVICSKHGEFEQRARCHMNGQGCPICAHDMRAKTCEERYGVAHPMLTEESREKSKQVVLDKYGVENIFQSEFVKRRIKETNLKKYGVENPMQSEDIKDKARSTNLSRYGVPCSAQNRDVKEKQKRSFKARYGVENPMQSKVVQKKANLRKKLNGTFASSGQEHNLYNRLCGVFGKNDVERQYSSKEYPFHCDFYIKSRNLYIELNAHWSHGSHWFNRNEDEMTLNSWRNRTDSEYYKTACETWSVRDVAKRETARAHNLTYVVFWSSDLQDIDLWFAMGCPDGCDWDREYSWIPDRKLSGNKCFEKLTGTHSNITAITKYYQNAVFYAFEQDLWNKNPEYNGLPLRVWLYCNRYKYLGKLPEQLSDSQLLRAFTISGIHKGYTTFDITLLNEVVYKYNIKSVYDPCAGWGERLLYCFCNDVKYLGVDVNAKLKDGYDNMIRDFSITNQRVVFADASKYDCMGGFDAVITCPPYGNIEIYSDKGAENLNEDDFLEWWRQVVSNCSAVRYFCFQINRKWRDRMLSIVFQFGYELIDELSFSSNKSSHFTRKKGENIKKEYETMLVLKKC